jgi:hypothetical protein
MPQVIHANTGRAASKVRAEASRADENDQGRQAEHHADLDLPVDQATGGGLIGRRGDLREKASTHGRDDQAREASGDRSGRLIMSCRLESELTHQDQPGAISRQLPHEGDRHEGRTQLGEFAQILILRPNRGVNRTEFSR